MPSENFVPKIDSVRALAMYDAGASDNAIANAFGVTRSGVCYWRRRHGLRRVACNDDRLTPSQIRQAKNMLRNGATRAQVAAYVGISSSSVQEIRREMDQKGLRQSGINGPSIRNAVIADKGLPRRIEKAIGLHVPRDVRMDAVNEMYLELLEGKLPVAEIERSAARFRSKAFEMAGFNRSTRSLDEANDNGFSLTETIADPGSLDPFEEVLERKFAEGG